MVVTRQCETVKAVVVTVGSENDVFFTLIPVHHRVVQFACAEPWHEVLCQVAVLREHAVLLGNFSCGLVNAQTR